MPPRKKTTSAPSKASAKYFTFRLSLNGLAGIALVTFCLFLFLFFLGMWAGETVVSPCPPAVVKQQAQSAIGSSSTTQSTTRPEIRSVPQSETETTVARPEEPAPSITPSTASTSPIYVQPRERKKRISFDEPSLYHSP
ncbi:MAG: hypothetical protein D3921_00720 [Candidatus Electrothrix sp. AW1]|nr:hypothetical protein [Candidatus Electrothrix sp. AX1]MCI5181053.1 hypothetical protein [Candidatus Electrothrix gigas]